MDRLRVAVPTTTIIATRPLDRFQIAVFRSTGKHGGKLVLPGGRVKVGQHDHLTTGLQELREELGLGLQDARFFCLSDRPDRDIRTISIGKWADGNPVPALFESSEVDAYICFDIAIYGRAIGEPKADGIEGTRAQWYDLRTLDREAFALDHGTLLAYFREFLETGTYPGLGAL